MAEAARSHSASHKLAEFQWDDAFLLDDQLTEDERLIRDTARQYAQEKLLPRVSEAYLEEKTDRSPAGGAAHRRCRRPVARPASGRGRPRAALRHGGRDAVATAAASARRVPTGLL